MENEEKKYYWKCPECQAEIEELEYDVPTSSYEYGKAYLTDKKPTLREGTTHITDYDIIDEHNADDQGDTEWSDGVTYKCTECDEGIRLQDLIWIGEEKLDKNCNKCNKEKKNCICNEPEETKFKIILAKHTIIDDDEIKDSSTSTIICKECKNIFVGFGGEKEWSDYNYGSKAEDISCECPKCGTSNTIEEFKKLLESNFFLQKRIRIQKHDRKKIKN